jgi:cytochrome b
VFRLLWGFVGSRHARFTDFFPTLPRLIAYLKGRWQGAGHNPLGALAVLALLGTLAALAGTGLFANDDIAFEGPLFDLIDKGFSDNLSGWHIQIVNLLLVLVGLHLTAIIFYQRVKKTNLILPMLTGKKHVPLPLVPATVQTAGALPLILSLLIAVSTVWGVWGGSFIDYLAPLAGVQTATADAKTSN